MKEEDRKETISCQVTTVTCLDSKQPNPELNGTARDKRPLGGSSGK
jgi:hypothetical protein